MYASFSASFLSLSVSMASISSPRCRCDSTSFAWKKPTSSFHVREMKNKIPTLQT